jgi:hypothetical protein
LIAVAVEECLVVEARWQRCTLEPSRSDVFCKVLHTLSRWNQIFANGHETQSFVKRIRRGIGRVNIHFANNQSLAL